MEGRKGKRVLVTGAGGFIGSHLAERLVELGARVRAMVRYNGLGRRGWLEESERAPDMEMYAGDLCDRDSVQRAVKGMDIVFHLGALIAIPYSYEAPGSYVRVNVEGTLNVLQAAREEGLERVVHTSTSEVYGTARYVPIDEQHPLQGQSPYAASKIGADKMAEAFHLSFGVPVVTVRPFNTFGPRQSMRAVIPTIIAQCFSGGPVRLGSLEPTRDLNYVQNTVDGFVSAALAPGVCGRVLNFGSGREIRIGDLAALIGRVAGREVSVETDLTRIRPAGSEVERLLASSELAKELTGWKPNVGLEEGLKQTVDWVEKNLSRYRVKEYVL